ncbi:Molybdopterin synthase catalytic subunit [Serratia rubidaea]|uniref:Molybdopterin synthase catalytic subunit n=1 Tax=Serratia rubidaea TaxID=61652 RepID=A0A4U9HJV8_SERRU|nr:Molybdopterin synthase catalytic subunit [Serratia rubidaea]
MVGAARFDLAQEHQWLSASDDDGAVVTFVGKVRSANLGSAVNALTLEHYPV